MTTTNDRLIDRTPCRWCEASLAGCYSLNFLGGRFCCALCAGSHGEAQ